MEGRTEIGAAPNYVVGKGTPTLLSLRAESSEVRILVNGPGMLFEKFRLVTTLGLIDGCHYPALKKLASELEAEVLCGSVGREPIDIEVATHRAGAHLEIGLGPASMYQSELIIRTRNGEALGKVIDSILTHRFIRDYVVALEPVPATGHKEHEHLALNGEMG